MTKTGFQIAIDGPSSSGKSTVAKQLAQELNYIYLDTGAMYRALTLAALQAQVSADDIEGLKSLLANISIDFAKAENGLGQKVFLNGQDVSQKIRQDRVSQAVSAYSARKEVRQDMVARQRRFAESGRGVIMDGRDIGTVVLPDAQVKIFLTASAQERARRRYAENQAKGYSKTSLAELQADIERRDAYDSNREESPLRQASDAILLDSSDLTLAEVESLILAEIKKKLG
ncbi:(d)CMP kinase [Aerococcus kribbianus]|uniref:Cytidylate kinase n=1 Tax=Aerococcus kribbianus TaxID=2999064 RepID=A0A9X3FNG0_9LACT|nr:MULTISPECIES: (d)CMP kinase [unclassified Aerococcus]MCZ0717655.1 (d)CMP kinase [Aerococcus sp. YH-aer221]MCZ0725943.1 (d)CMP kinase [Aerococcus sp. YH-aer222]